VVEAVAAPTPLALRPWAPPCHLEIKGSSTPKQQTVGGAGFACRQIKALNPVAVQVIRGHHINCPTLKDDDWVREGELLLLHGRAEDFYGASMKFIFYGAERAPPRAILCFLVAQLGVVVVHVWKRLRHGRLQLRVDLLLLRRVDLHLGRLSVCAVPAWCASVSNLVSLPCHSHLLPRTASPLAAVQCEALHLAEDLSRDGRVRQGGALRKA
jgi:hypothetical protein